MTVPLDTVNDIRSMDAAGRSRVRDRPNAPPEPEHRGEVRRHGGHVARRADAPEEGTARRSTTGSSPSAATAALTPPCRGSSASSGSPGRRRAERGTSSSSGRPAPARSISGTSAPRSAGGPSTSSCWSRRFRTRTTGSASPSCRRGRSACAPGCSRSSAAGAAPRRRWCSTTPPRRAGWYAARSRNRGCSRSSEPTTASRAGTATPIRETRRAPSRTPWGSSGATSSSPCLRSARSPSSTRSSPRGARGSTRRRAAATAGRTGRPTGRTSPPCAPFPAWSSTR